MILVDTSAWIDYFNEKDTEAKHRVDLALLTGRTIVGDLILAEVLQGVRDDRKLRHIAGELGKLRQQSLCGSEIATLAAANYRMLRRRGVTIRGTIDVIIATWCISVEAEIIHNDRDLRQMEVFLGLRPYA